MVTSEASRTDLEARIKRRLGVAPRLFEKLDPEHAETLWEQAELSYLDNPLPPLFKERLVVFLARFFDTPSCLARHLTFLMHRPAGDESARGLDADETLQWLEHMLPRGDALDQVLDRLEAGPFPEPGSERERDIVDCAAHVFLHTPRATRCRIALQQALPEDAYAHLVALLAFMENLRIWSDAHPVEGFEPDVEELLAREPELAAWIAARWPDGIATSGDEWPDGRNAVVEVSRLEAAETKLQERTAELEAIVENMADGLIVQDASGAIVRANRAALAAPAPVLDPDAADDRFRICDSLGAPLPEHAWPSSKARRFEPFRGDEITIVDRKTGRRWTGLFSGVAVHGTDEPGMFITTFRDVTDRKRAHDELRASEQRLREISDRKDEFLAMLGHELRNPLSSIRSVADMLHLLPMEDHRVERLRRVLDRQSSHMAKLVDGLLDAARVVRGKVRLDKQLVPVREVVTESVTDHRAEAEELGVTLEVGPDGDDLYVLADRVRLTQILDNLIANALKYTRSGGHVRVETERDDSEVVLRVKDDGVGMTPELIAHLFEPFQQGPQPFHRPQGGLGLGLAVVRGLVERHGGRIQAFSEGPNRGSTLEVRLPLVPPPVVRESKPGKVDGLHVLVVEDEPDYADTLRMLLETLGHEVQVAHDGNEALERAFEAPPDVVLCDLGLPNGMSGYDVAEALLQSNKTRDAYLVALTGFSRNEDRQRAEQAGFDDFLAKPAGAEAIQAAIRRARPR